MSSSSAQARYRPCCQSYHQTQPDSAPAAAEVARQCATSHNSEAYRRIRAFYMTHGRIPTSPRPCRRLAYPRAP
eukprot:IDg10090t1